MPNDQVPTELQTELDRINTGVGRYIAKIFTFVLTPLILPLATSLAYGLQKWFGMELDAAELTGYLTAIASGIGISAYKWIGNRGEWERSVVQLAQWHKLGQQAGGGPIPPTPPR